MQSHPEGAENLMYHFLPNQQYHFLVRVELRWRSLYQESHFHGY